MVPAVSARQLAVSLRAALVRHPALPLAAVALATSLWFAGSNGGYDGSTWLPGALIVLALVVIGALTVPDSDVPRLVKVAAIALLEFAAWNYLSITWSPPKGQAWDRATRMAEFPLAFSL